MPFDQGPLSWQAFSPFVRPPVFAGIALSNRLASIRIDPVPAGVEIPMLDGGSVSQVEPQPEGASLSRATQEVTLGFSAATEGDSRLAGYLAALCREGPQSCVLWNVHSDYWRIGAETRTSWTLSRDSAPTPPDVHSGEIIGADGSVTSLTLVGGAPGAGEISISGSTATTANLAASSGSLLHVRYYPVFQVVSVLRSQDYAESGNLAFELTLREWLR